MNDAAIGAFVLKMYEPRFTGGRVNPRALMRPVDSGLALRQDYLSFVRAVDIFRAQSQLPARLDASGRSEDVIKAVSFIKLRAFDRRIFVMAIKNQHTIVKQLRAIVAHAADNQDAFDTGATARKSIHEIGFAVINSKGTWIDPALREFDQEWL